MADLFTEDGVDLKPVSLPDQCGIIPFATHNGTVTLLGTQMRAHQLSNGTVVVVLEDLHALIRDLQE